MQEARLRRIKLFGGKRDGDVLPYDGRTPMFNVMVRDESLPYTIREGVAKIDAICSSIGIESYTVIGNEPYFGLRGPYGLLAHQLGIAVGYHKTKINEKRALAWLERTAWAEIHALKALVHESQARRETLLDLISNCSPGSGPDLRCVA